MHNKIVTMLENSLARTINASNTHQVNDVDVFEAFCAPFLKRKNALKAIKAYLQTGQYSPRILGLLIYSQTGRAYLNHLMDNGMSCELIYRALQFDGGFWLKANAHLALSSEIGSTSEKWQFDPKAVLSKIEPMTCVPGLIEALFEQCRLRDAMGNVFRYIPASVLKRIVEHHPDALNQELKGVTVQYNDSGDLDNESLVDQMMCHIVSPETRFGMLIGHKIAI